MTLEAFPLADPDDVDRFPFGEEIRPNFLALVESVTLFDPELPEPALRRDILLRVVPPHRLVQPLGFHVTEAELDRAVLVLVRGAHFHHRTGARLDHRDGDRLAFGVKHLGHSDLAAQDPHAHLPLSLLSTQRFPRATA